MTVVETNYNFRVAATNLSNRLRWAQDRIRGLLPQAKRERRAVPVSWKRLANNRHQFERLSIRHARRRERVFLDPGFPTHRRRIVPRLMHHMYEPIMERNRGASTVPQEPAPLEEITIQGGTTPQLGVDETIDVGPNFNALAVWTGNYSADTAHVTIYVNIDGTTYAVNTFRDSFFIISASANSQIAMQAQKRTGNSSTETNVNITVKVQPFLKPVAITAPTAITGATVYCDKNGPPYWEPSVGHIVLTENNSAFQVVGDSVYREIFICEQDAYGEWTTPRWVPIHPDAEPIIRVRNKIIAVATYDGSTIDINAPAGTFIGGTSAEYAPDVSDFTGTERTVSADSDGFGGDQGDLAANLAFCLKSGSLNDRDIVTIETGGSATISWTSTNVMNLTNYGAAQGKNLWIRCLDGVLTFDTNTWGLSISVGKRWHLQGLVIDVGSAGTIVPTSGTAIINMTGAGRVSMHECTVRGLTNGTNDAGVAITASGGANVTTEFSYCTFGLAKGDSVQTFGSTATCILTCFACTYNGNGSATQHQVLTTHNAATNIAYDWGGIVTDDESANITRIAADSAGSIYLFYTKSLSANIAHATEGVVLQGIRGAFGCYFEKCGRVTPRNGYLIGSTFLQLSASTAPFFQVLEDTGNNEWVGRCIVHGCRFRSAANSGNHGCEVRFWVTASGCLFEAQHTSDATAFNTAGAPASPCTALFVNCYFTHAGTSLACNIGTSANLSVHWYNCIVGSGGAWVVGATGAECAAVGCMLRRNPASAPTNWATRFTTDVGNDWHNGAPDLAADGTPNVGDSTNSCDDEGIDIDTYGGMDRYGRILWYGANWVRGPVARAEIIDSAVLFPTVSL